MRALTLNEFYSRDTIFFGHHMSSYFVHHRGNYQDHHFLSYGTDFFQANSESLKCIGKLLFLAIKCNKVVFRHR